uniref:Uncharacterized protein LOC111125422 n=1 Tax=Crassostrea virginica TaxID=6565 RepID=A0A8B8DB72_CRAVI|nr:uncharacterized protein LOC111125422 [Crassostrea virginica]
MFSMSAPRAMAVLDSLKVTITNFPTDQSKPTSRQTKNEALTASASISCYTLKNRTLERMALGLLLKWKPPAGRQGIQRNQGASSTGCLSLKCVRSISTRDYGVQ